MPACGGAVTGTRRLLRLGCFLCAFDLPCCFVSLQSEKCREELPEKEREWEREGGGRERGVAGEGTQAGERGEGESERLEMRKGRRDDAGGRVVHRKSTGGVAGMDTRIF